MTDEEYIQNQRKFIKREQKIILRNHWHFSWLVLLLIAVLIAISITQVHPDHWQETTIILKSYEVVPTGRAGSRLDIYDTTGNRYTINRNESNIMAQLAIGQKYTFTYAKGLLHNIVEVIQINDVEILDHEGSVKNYKTTQSVLWVLVGIFFVGLVAINVFCYKAITYDRIKKIRKYQQRIQQRR